MGHEFFSRTNFNYWQEPNLWSAGWQFFANVNLREFQVLIFDMQSFSAEISEVQSKSGGYGESLGIFDEIRFKLIEILKWIYLGNSLFIIGNKFPQSVPGRSYRELEPFSWIEFHYLGGRLLEYCGPPIAQEIFVTILPLLRYQAILNGDGLEPLLKVSTGDSGPRQLVGGYRRHGAGLVIYLPGPPQPGGQSDLKTVSDYWDKLLLLPSLLTTGDVELPLWAASYQTTEERRMIALAGELRAKESKIRSEIESVESKLKKLEAPKHLYTDTGDGLVQAAKAALQTLGLVVEDGPHPRADLIASDGKRIAAIEVKGLLGSAKESNVRQCQQWRQDIDHVLTLIREEQEIGDPDLKRYKSILEKLGVPIFGPEAPEEAAGIMIIGTYRELPLEDRRDLDFPDAAARAAKRLGISAMTGLQLFCLTRESQESDGSRQGAIDLLFSGAGVLAAGSDWHKHLEIEGATAA
jgi:hypothetical protein